MIKGRNVQVKANHLLSSALSSGKIKKEPCCVCGDIKSEGHHEDYSKPLDVIWLCSKHHAETHTRHDTPVKNISGVLKYKTAMYLNMLPSNPHFISKSLGVSTSTIATLFSKMEMEGRLVKSEWRKGRKTVYLTKDGERELAKALLAYGEAVDAEPQPVEPLARKMQAVWLSSEEDDPWLSVAREIQNMYGSAVLRNTRVF